MANNVEKRFLTNGFEVRAEQGKPTVVEGYAAVFNDETVIGGSFAERIARNAFDGADMTNTVALFNHDINKPLARAGHGLELSVDERGLKYRFEVGDQSYAKDLVENIRMGNVSTSSFGFTVRDDEWEMRDDMNLRTIKEVGLLFDVSPTTQGAYPTTEVGLRSMELALENEGILAAEQEAVRAYKDEEEEEEENREEEEEEEEEEEATRSEERDNEEEDCGCDDNEIKPVQREAEETLETADAPVAEESAEIIERGAESEISMNEEKNAPAVVQGLGDKVQNVRARFDLGKAIREAANGGLTGLEAEMSQEGTNEFRQGGISVGGGINIPSMLLRADAAPMGTESVGDEGSETLLAGGALATEVQGPLQNYRPVTFADKMGIRKITGVTGDISIPVQSSNVTASEMTNENDAVDSTNVAFSNVTLSPDRLSAHTKATQMLLAQNSFDLQAFLAADIRRELELAYNTKIKGVIEGIIEVDASNTSLEYKDYAFYLEQLLREGNVDPIGAYILTEPTLYRNLRQATLDAGSGVFAADSVSRIGDYSAIVSTLFTDGNAYMVKPEDMVVAEWGGLNIMVDPYTEAHKDVVRIIANMYVDCGILRTAGVKGITA